MPRTTAMPTRMSPLRSKHCTIKHWTNASLIYVTTRCQLSRMHATEIRVCACPWDLFYSNPNCRDAKIWIQYFCIIYTIFLKTTEFIYNIVFLLLLIVSKDARERTGNELNIWRISDSNAEIWTSDRELWLHSRILKWVSNEGRNRND